MLLSVGMALLHYAVHNLGIEEMRPWLEAEQGNAAALQG